MKNECFLGFAVDCPYTTAGYFGVPSLLIGVSTTTIPDLVRSKIDRKRFSTSYVPISVGFLKYVGHMQTHVKQCVL